MESVWLDSGPVYDRDSLSLVVSSFDSSHRSPPNEAEAEMGYQAVRKADVTPWKTIGGTVVASEQLFNDTDLEAGRRRSTEIWT